MVRFGLARDKNNTKYIIELKVNEPKIILWQAAYNPANSESEKISRIIIAPYYSTKIYKALEKVKNVEIKRFFKSEEDSNYDTISSVSLVYLIFYLLLLRS